MSDNERHTDDEFPDEEESGIKSLLPEAATGNKSLAEALEESLHQPVQPVVYTPEDERFPPLRSALVEDEPPVVPIPAVRAAPPQRRFQGGDWRHNLVALLFLLFSIGLCGYYTAFWVDPYGGWNPLAIPTDYLNVTWTPDPRMMVNLSGTQTAEAMPSLTPSPQMTSSVAMPTTATTADGTATSIVALLIMPFTLEDPGVLYTPNANGRGCDWASIAGTVTDIAGQAVNEYIIHIVDATDVGRLNVQVYSGGAHTFGEGGFEFNLGGSPREGQYVLQLLNPDGIPVSDEFLIFTRNVCNENVAIVNFVQVVGD
jgi:hypothetical protein